jgi:hypothetical protein
VDKLSPHYARQTYLHRFPRLGLYVMASAMLSLSVPAKWVQRTPPNESDRSDTACTDL